MWIRWNLDCKIQPVHSEGDQFWVFFGRNDAKAETPVLWPPHAKSWLIEKDSDAGRDWGQEEKGTTEDEMAGWHHWLDGCESEWTPGVGNGQGGLACYDSRGRKESDWATELNWTELKVVPGAIFYSELSGLFLAALWGCCYQIVSLTFSTVVFRAVNVYKKLNSSYSNTPYIRLKNESFPLKKNLTIFPKWKAIWNARFCLFVCFSN